MLEKLSGQAASGYFLDGGGGGEILEYFGLSPASGLGREGK